MFTIGVSTFCPIGRVFRVTTVKAVHLVIMLIILAACGPQAGVEVEPEQPGITEGATPQGITPTAASLEPLPTATPSSPPTPTQSLITPATPGTVSGEICNPDAGLPAMTVYFENVETSALRSLSITKAQSSYSLDLPPGQYIGYAYLNQANTSGGLYSAAVPCGLTAGCTNHNPVVFVVEARQAVSGIDICDWSAPEYVPPNPAPFEPRLAGMVYRLKDVNYFRYDEEGQAQLLMSTPFGVGVPFQLEISPDGKRGVFRDEEKNDLFIVDFSSGERFNLTNTPQVYESAYTWDPGLPETIVFKAIEPGQEPDPFSGGLYAIDVDGSQHATLDIEHNVANFDISPDGQTIAYGVGETGWLYKRDSGATVFDPRQYSQSLPNDLVIASPSWSPDGKRIAWYMRGFFSEQYQEGVGIFDLDAKTFQLIHPWAGDGRGPGYPPSGSWSPDGKWLAITSYDPDPERRGVWLVNVDDPEKETFIGASTVSPLFSPDGKWLAYHDYEYEKGSNQVWLYNPNTGEHEKISLPPAAWAVDW